MSVANDPLRPASPSRLGSWVAVVAALAVLVARKPWALTTPQFWAEDGSIHLNAVEQHGISALFIPYRGYLNLLPRLVAWISAHVADAAAWPALYNGATFLVTAILLIRILSPRLPLPGKPWLILAITALPQSGEALLNLTNLHWVAGLFLVQQLLMARPTTWVQRVGDYSLILLAGLSDPCAVILLPAFAWKLWQERDRDVGAEFGLVAAAAAAQLYCMHTTGLQVDGAFPAFRLLRFLEITGSRLVIWPLFGRSATQALPLAVQGVSATILIAALLLWALRRDDNRPVRIRVIFAWVLITFACLYRTRPDTWVEKWHVDQDNLGFAEPYFYAPRLLLIWLLILEFNARQRLVAWGARLACVVGVMLEAPYYRLPAPPDYHWAEKCDPIRRGVPANIPTLPEGWIFGYLGRPATH